MINSEEKSQGEMLAQHIADALKDHPHAEVRVKPSMIRLLYRRGHAAPVPDLPRAPL